MYIVKLIEKRKKGALANMRSVLPYGGQRRQRILAQGNVVEADDTEVLRDP